MAQQQKYRAEDQHVESHLTGERQRASGTRLNVAAFAPKRSKTAKQNLERVDKLSRSQRFNQDGPSLPSCAPKTPKMSKLLLN